LLNLNLPSAKERIVGWYHSGPQLAHNDIKINAVMKRFVDNPVRAFELNISLTFVDPRGG
jgi:hypothetical protein